MDSSAVGLLAFTGFKNTQLRFVGEGVFVWNRLGLHESSNLRWCGDFRSAAFFTREFRRIVADSPVMAIWQAARQMPGWIGQPG
jgi:hypothetical protein